MKRLYAGGIGKGLLFGLLLTFWFPASAAAQVQNYYVATTGSDANDGSQAHPWATINHADSALRIGTAGPCTAASGWNSTSGVGACIHVASGSYAGAIATTKSGTASARIHYVSDTQYGARLTGSNGNSVLWSNHGAFTDMFGFEVDGSLNPGVQNGIICYADGNHCWIFGNKVHDIAVNGGAWNGTGAMGGANVTSASANRYENNLIYHNNGGGSSSFNNPAGNDGISMQWGDIARNNIIIDQGGGRCIQSWHTSTGSTVTNNTLINCAQGGILLGNASVIDDFSTFTNNIVIDSGVINNNGGIRVFSANGCGPHNIYANNLMYGNIGGNYIFDSGCPNTSTGTQSGSNSTTFVNYTGTVSGDYHLKAGTSSIGAGTMNCASGATTPCVPTIDFEQIVRPTPPSIGAHESAAAGSLSPAAPSGLTAVVQ